MSIKNRRGIAVVDGTVNSRKEKKAKMMVGRGKKSKRREAGLM